MNTEVTSAEEKQMDQAIGILENVFGDEINRTTYRNKIFGNPFKLPAPLSLSYEGAEPAGISAFMGMKLILNGEELPVSQALDCAVLEQFRGKGHFFNTLEAYETLDNGSKFIIGLPNNTSFPRFLKRGYIKPMWLCHYIYATSPLSFIFGENGFTKAFDRLYRRFLWIKKASAKNDEDLKIFDGMNTIPVSDAELALAAREHGCYFLHTGELFDWKQSYNPEMHFYWATLRKKNGTLLGYALCHLRPRLRGNFVIIDDFGTTPECTDKKHSLRVLFSSLSDLGNITEVPFVNNEKEGPLLASLHFKNACRFPYPLRGGPMIVSPDCNYVEEMKNCHFRNIDSDVL